MESPTPSNTLGAILVGGQSRRMGRPKMWLPLPDGGTILEHTARVLKPVAAEIILSGELPSSDKIEWPVWPDETPGKGPLPALLTVMKRSSHPWVIFAACDLPLLTSQVFAQLAASYVSGDQVLIPRGSGEPLPNPLCGYYRADLAARLASAIAGGQRSVMSFLRDCRVRQAPIADAKTVRSANSAEDYERLTGIRPIQS